jgi:acyl carrier protein
MSEPVDPIESEVRDLLLRILRLPSAPAGLARGDTAEWDSLKHLEIVFALEDRYGVRFDESEFATLDSAATIAASLRRHLAT